MIIFSRPLTASHRRHDHENSGYFVLHEMRMRDDLVMILKVGIHTYTAYNGTQGE